MISSRSIKDGVKRKTIAWTVIAAGVLILTLALTGCGSDTHEQPTFVRRYIPPEQSHVDVAKNVVYEVCARSWTVGGCGTGFLVRHPIYESPNGEPYEEPLHMTFIVTAAHVMCDEGNCATHADVRNVIKGDVGITERDASGFELSSALFWYSIDRDIAVIVRVPELDRYDADGELFTVPLATIPERGDELTGIAWDGKLFTLVRQGVGNITCEYDYCLPVRGASWAGTSGSPVLNGYGDVSGMLVAGTEDGELSVVITGVGLTKTLDEARDVFEESIRRIRTEYE